MTRQADDFPTRIASWADLAQVVEHFSYFSGHDWLFRGVTDETRGLIPKIGREKTRGMKAPTKGAPKVRLPYRREDEDAVFAMFKQQARPHLAFDPSSKLEWLAIAQHFGLPTRLLDWTDMLLVAVWFAVGNAGSGKAVDSAVWVTRGLSYVDLDFPDDPLEIQETKVYRPPHISPRITAQGSVLMICPNPTTETALPFKKKIVIDRAAEFMLRKRLNASGLNKRHLFPDLSGLTEHLAWVYKNDWLSGYRKRGVSTIDSTGDLDESPD